MATVRDIIDSIMNLRTPTPEADLLASVTFSAITVNSSGNVTIKAPTSGKHEIDTFGFVEALRFGFQASGTTAGYHVYYDTTNAAVRGFFGFGTSAFTGGALTDFGMASVGGTLRLSANNGTTTQLSITNAGVVSAWEGTYNVGTAAVMQVATVESGTFTGTLTGCTTSPTTTVNWRRVGTSVTLNMPANLTATSNATTVSITGLTAALSPVALQRCATSSLEDNTAFAAGYISIAAGSTTLSGIHADQTAFTASGTKGFVAFTITYNLN